MLSVVDETLIWVTHYRKAERKHTQSLDEISHKANVTNENLITITDKLNRIKTDTGKTRLELINHSSELTARYC